MTLDNRKFTEMPRSRYLWSIILQPSVQEDCQYSIVANIVIPLVHCLWFVSRLFRQPRRQRLSPL